MVVDNTAKPARSGLSLYANLIDPKADNSPAPGTISKAPVLFKQSGGQNAAQDDTAAPKQQISAGRYSSAPVK